LAWLAISGGLAPCPTALVLMLGAIAVGRAGLGLILVTVFSAGLALVLSGIGLVFLYGGKRLASLPVARLPGLDAALRLLPLAGAVVVTLAGTLITLRAALETGLL
jgi:ABC-type nickel/cobalt efflux system permease component RcnA